MVVDYFHVFYCCLSLNQNFHLFYLPFYWNLFDFLTCEFRKLFSVLMPIFYSSFHSLRSCKLMKTLLDHILDQFWIFHQVIVVPHHRSNLILIVIKYPMVLISSIEHKRFFRNEIGIFVFIYLWL